jgi:cytidine deaminase
MSQQLIDAARAARLNACAPYSHFLVGAALLSKDGRIFTGCNIENVSYGLTVCAERVALWKALSEGARTFTQMAIVGDKDHPTPPCGACRQLLWEYCGDLEIILANLVAEKGRYQLKDLYPLPFDAQVIS